MRFLFDAVYVSATVQSDRPAIRTGGFDVSVRAANPGSVQRGFARAAVVSRPRMRATGLIPRADVAALFAQSSIFCLPNVVEASVEVMASKPPIVATNDGGFPDMVIDGETGFLVPPNDPVILAGALSELLANPMRARAMETFRYDRGCNCFTWEAVGTRLQAEIASLPYPQPVPFERNCEAS